METFFRMGRGWGANPAAVEREGRVTRTTAGKVCEALASRGLLVREMKRSKNKRDESAHYRLRDGPQGFRLTTLAYFDALRFLHGDNWSNRAYLQETKYAREELTADLVRALLLERQVVMRVGIEAPQHLLRERDVIFGVPRRSFYLTLPLAPRTGLNADAMARQAVRDVSSTSDELERAAEAFLVTWATDHYREGELRRLVLPILALCEVSPRALETFLSPWQVHTDAAVSTRGSGFTMIDHVVFRMVFDAVGDLSDARDVPMGSDVTFAEVCPEHEGVFPDMGTLLQLTWKSEGRIGYAAGFDTDHEFYGPGEDDSGPMAAILSGKPPEEWTPELLFGDNTNIVESVRNPENAWVYVTWSSTPLSFFDAEVTAAEKILHYRFNDRELLRMALTHSTLENESDRAGNQRLAHLGDAVIELAIRQRLYKRFPTASRGDLTRMKQHIVSDANLARVAQELHLAEHLARGRGQVKDKDNETVLAEALEALIGAVYLDSNLRLVSIVLDKVLPSPVPTADAAK